MGWAAFFKVCFIDKNVIYVKKENETKRMKYTNKN